MRPVWRLCGLLSLLALAGGCDTTQPLQLDQQTFHFEVRGVTASINTYDVWDMYEDVNGNMQHDADEQLYMFCVTKGSQIIGPQSVPFPFKIRMSILRAGQTEAEILTSNQALLTTANMTLYDDAAIRYGGTAEKLPIVINDDGELRTFRFINPRMMTAAREEVVAATTNPLYEFNPVVFGLGSGRCSTAYPGPAKIDLQPQPMAILLNKGDTLVVELRRGTTPPPGIPLNVNGEPMIRAILRLDGREVAVRGETVTTKVPDDGISFSFTAL